MPQAPTFCIPATSWVASPAFAVNTAAHGEHRTEWPGLPLYRERNRPDDRRS